MIEFVPMSPDEYEAWRKDSTRGYASENVTSGRWTDQDASLMSEREFAALLPNGLSTEDNFLYSIVDTSNSKRVGVIWYALQREGDRKLVFLYDLVIFKDSRRKGYGTQALLDLEGRVRAMGVRSISLHVFAHNKAARKLYKNVGYNETDIVMTRVLI